MLPAFKIKALPALDVIFNWLLQMGLSLPEREIQEFDAESEQSKVPDQP